MTAAIVTKTSAGSPASPASSGPASSGPASSGPASSSSASPSAPASSPAAVRGGKRQAEAAAAALLAEFVPPPGARRLAGPPELPGGWEPGKRFILGDADVGPPSWDREFDLPVAGALTSRALIVEVVGAGNGQTAIRLDADVAWRPFRPPHDVVPNSARVVTISEVAGESPQAKRLPVPVTITDPAVTRRLAVLVDSLPVSPLNDMVLPCPVSYGDSLRLAFRTRIGGPVIALVQTDQPCGMVDLTVTGQRLLGLDNNINVDRRILAIASLSWKLS
jgi:hypothetical protein